MTPSSPTPATTFHEEERTTNKEKWEEKPDLQQEYGKFYLRMKGEMDPTLGPSLELGSGLCHIKHWIPKIETSEPLDQGKADSLQSAYAIQKPDSSLGNILALDVWHHLESPAAALKEWHRVLRTNGKVILIEPAMGLLGNFIYSHLHHEGTGWNKSLGLVEAPKTPTYFTAQSSAHRIFLKKELPKLLIGWKVKTERWPALPYLATGGYKKQCPGGELARCLSQKVEPLANLVPSLFATRMLIVLKKL